MNYTGTDISYKDSSALTISFNKVALQVLYSNNPVTLQSTPVSYLPAESSIPIVVDISMNISTNPSLNTFSAYAYLGNLTISNVLLQTQVGYIYDFRVAVNFNCILSNNYTTYFGLSNPTIGIYTNSSFATATTQSYNASIVNPPYPIINESTFPQLKISGI